MSATFCARVPCGEPASAVLLINARDLAVQLVDVGDDAIVAGVPLCRAHADAVVVPLGWTKADSRSLPSGPDLVLVDEAAADSTDSSGTLRLPVVEEDFETDMEDTAVGEIPPLLSRAFRAAGLD